jgi:dipeptidyl-peptidase-4
MTPPHMTLLVMATLMTATTPIDTSFLREYAETRRYLAGRPASPKFTPDGKSVLFLRAQPKNPAQTLFELDVADAALAAIRRANALGGPDNVTAIFVELAA